MTRHADDEAISGPPALFCSGRGAVSTVHMSADRNEFVGSMISMDDSPPCADPPDRRAPGRPADGCALTAIEVDRDRCARTGGCEAAAPAVFEVRDDGVLGVLRPEPDERDLPDVRAAVRACPTLALTLHE